MMSIEYVVYILIVVLVSIILLSRAKKRVFFSLFLFWLFGSPIFLHPRYVISLNFFGIEIQPNRFLFLFLAPMLYVSIMMPRRNLTSGGSIKSSGLRLYEKLLIGYILVVLFGLVLNIGSLGLRRVIVDATNIIAFIAVYFCLKTFLKKDDFVLFQAAILIFATISAIVGLYQFFVNPEFFRLGVLRREFLGYARSHGLFTVEYDQGLYLNLSIIVAMSMNLKWWTRASFVVLGCAAIFTTLHRMSWVVLFIILGLNFFLYARKKLLTYMLLPPILIAFIIGALYVPWSKVTTGRFGSSLLANRILADTITGRIDQYRLSFALFKEYPLGIGGYATPFYNWLAYSHGLDLYRRSDNTLQAYIVHNGALSAGVRYGILGLIFFPLFIFSSIFYFLKCYIHKGKVWYPPLMIMLCFAIANLTNDFSSLGTQIGVTVAWLVGGYVSTHGN